MNRSLKLKGKLFLEINENANGIYSNLLALKGKFKIVSACIKITGIKELNGASQGPREDDKVRRIESFRVTK